jgi:hypothetical protein
MTLVFGGLEQTTTKTTADPYGMTNKGTNNGNGKSNGNGKNNCNGKNNGNRNGNGHGQMQGSLPCGGKCAAFGLDDVCFFGAASLGSR